MKRIHFLIFIITIFIFFSCAKSIQKVEFTVSDIIEINTPYITSVRNSGLIYITQDSSLLYFYNTKTFHQIDVFSQKGIFIKSISLKVLDNENINQVCFYNKDTILALTHNSNILYTLDSNGKLLSFKNLSNTPILNYHIELDPSIYNHTFILNTKSLIFHSTYYCDTNDTLIDPIKQHYEVNKSQPYFCEIKNFQDISLQFIYHFPNFYSRFLNPKNCNVEGTHFTTTDTQILQCSSYTDSLYVLNKNTFALDTILKLKSSFTKIGMKAIDYDKNIQDSISIYFQTQGSICDMQFDTYNQLYYISLTHSILLNSTRKEKGINRNWSVLVFDTKFNFINEIKMPKGKYLPGSFICTKYGLLLALNDLKKSKYQMYHVKKK